jgi:TolB protein
MADSTAHERTTRRGGLILRAGMCWVVAAAVAVAVAACGSSGAGPTGARPAKPAVARSASAQAAVQALPAGQQGTRQQVPWAHVGPGWILAEWTATLIPPAPTSLFLVDPVGGRYLIDTLSANPTGSASMFLMAWSGDGQRALLTSTEATPTVEVLNLRTLATTQFQLANAFPVGFTRPDGLAILVNVNPNASPVGPFELERVSLTGQLEFTYPESFGPGGVYDGSALYSPDGTELAVGTSAGIELMTNQGQGLSPVNVSPSVNSCSVLRWWAPEELLANCLAGSSAQLWLVPTSGGTSQALTASPPAPGDLGDSDAWQLPSGIYLQEAGACSYVYMAKLQPNGLTAPVAVPGVPSGESIVILGALGDRLAIRNVPGSPMTCAHGPSLMWFDPGTNSVTPVLGGPVNGGYAEAAVLFGER